MQAEYKGQSVDVGQVYLSLSTLERIEYIAMKAEFEYQYEDVLRMLLDKYDRETS